MLPPSLATLTLPRNTQHWPGISAGGGILLRGAGVDFTFGPRGALPPRGGVLHYGRYVEFEFSVNVVLFFLSSLCLSLFFSTCLFLVLSTSHEFVYPRNRAPTPLTSEVRAPR